MRVISLLYHDVVDPGAQASSGFAGGDADIYKLERLEFARHLAEISRCERGRARLTIFDLLSASAPEGLLLTFDDGGIGAVEHTADLLEDQGWRGHFFITTDYIGRPGFLAAAHIRDLHARGHVIGSHSCSHPARMALCDPEQMRREWSQSVEVLSDILGLPVRVASVPGGYFSNRVAEAAARAGIRALFTSEPTTRVLTRDGCRIFGRYSIQQGVAAETAAAIARGRPGPRWRQAAYWTFKKVLKTVGGRHWLRLRQALLNRGKTDASRGRRA